MITDREILDAARASGLHQRLAVVEYSTIPTQQHEAEIIKAELARRAMAADLSQDDLRDLTQNL